MEGDGGAYRCAGGDVDVIDVGDAAAGGGRVVGGDQDVVADHLRYYAVAGGEAGHGDGGAYLGVGGDVDVIDVGDAAAGGGRVVGGDEDVVADHLRYAGGDAVEGDGGAYRCAGGGVDVIDIGDAAAGGGRVVGGDQDVVADHLRVDRSRRPGRAWRWWRLPWRRWQC